MRRDPDVRSLPRDWITFARRRAGRAGPIAGPDAGPADPSACSRSRMRRARPCPARSSSGPSEVAAASCSQPCRSQIDIARSRALDLTQISRDEAVRRTRDGRSAPHGKQIGSPAARIPSIGENVSMQIAVADPP